MLLREFRLFPLSVLTNMQLSKAALLSDRETYPVILSPEGSL